MAAIVYIQKFRKKLDLKRWIGGLEEQFLTITQIRSHVNFGNNLREARAKKVRFFFFFFCYTEMAYMTCYINWAILIGDPVDVTTLLLQSPLGYTSDL